VLTTSRRRRRRLRGGVLACAAAALTGGTTLALSETEPPQHVALGGAPTSETFATDPVSGVPPESWPDLAAHYCAGDYDATWGELGVIYIQNDVPERDLADEFSAATFDGYDLRTGPQPPEDAYVWPREISIDPTQMVVLFADQGHDRDFALTVDGATATFEVPTDPGGSSWPQQVPSPIEGLTFEWQPLDELCASPSSPA
jgi:hypothetical protein